MSIDEMLTILADMHSNPHEVRVLSQYIVIIHDDDDDGSPTCTVYRTAGALSAVTKHGDNLTALTFELARHIVHE